MSRINAENYQCRDRELPPELFVTRDDSTESIQGICAPFNSDCDFGYYIERYAPGCFERTLRERPDVFALRDHDTGRVVGRTTAGDLELREDADGLVYKFAPPDTTEAQDLAKDVKARRITSCSIGFVIRKESWEKRTDGTYIVTLEDVDLWEMSFVAFPAYKDTTAASQRSRFEAAVRQIGVDPAIALRQSEQRKRQLEIARRVLPIVGM